MSRRYGSEPKSVTRSLRAARGGSQRELREGVRCMLIRLMGFADCSEVRRGEKIPHRFPGKSGLTYSELRELAFVAHDGLLELGYDAAAESLAVSWSDRESLFKVMDVHAKQALEILEAGPPSVRLDTIVVFKSPMYRLQGTRWNPDQEVLIAKRVDRPSRPWVRFLVGREGRYDRNANVHAATFHKTLAEAKGYER